MHVLQNHQEVRGANALLRNWEVTASFARGRIKALRACGRGLGRVAAVGTMAWIWPADFVRAQDFDSRTTAFIHDAVAGQPPSGSSADPVALAEAREALQAAGLLGAQRVATSEPDIVEAYGRALLLGTRARQFLPELAATRNAAIRRDRDVTAAAIEQLFVKAGRSKPDPASMTKYVEAVIGAGASEGPAETARRGIEKPGRSITITDAKRAGLFTIEVTTTLPGGQPNRTVVVAERTVRPDASGTGLEQRAVPVRACTVTAAQASQRRAALNGEWIDQNGATWDVSGSGETISLVERRPERPIRTYTGTYRLGRIQGTHAVGAANEIDPPLPEWLRKALVGKTSFVARLDDCGDGKLHGTWESRHVTYDPRYKVISRIHDPYDLALVLTRPRADRPRLRLVERTDGSEREIKGQLTFFGGPVIAELRFETEQADSEKTIVIEWGVGQGKGRAAFPARRSTADPLLYRTDEFFIMPPPPRGQNAGFPVAPARPVVEP